MFPTAKIGVWVPNKSSRKHNLNTLKTSNWDWTGHNFPACITVGGRLLSLAVESPWENKWILGGCHEFWLATVAVRPIEAAKMSKRISFKRCRAFLGDGARARFSVCKTNLEFVLQICTNLRICSNRTHLPHEKGASFRHAQRLRFWPRQSFRKNDWLSNQIYYGTL